MPNLIARTLVSGLASAVSPKLISRGGVPKKPWVHILPVPDTYRFVEFAAVSHPEVLSRVFRRTNAFNVFDQPVFSFSDVSLSLIVALRCSRGPYTESDPMAHEKYFLDAKAILDEQVQAGRKVALDSSAPNLDDILICEAKPIMKPSSGQINSIHGRN